MERVDKVRGNVDNECPVDCQEQEISQLSRASGSQSFASVRGNIVFRGRRPMKRWNETNARRYETLFKINRADETKRSGLFDCEMRCIGVADCGDKRRERRGQLSSQDVVHRQA